MIKKFKYDSESRYRILSRLNECIEKCNGFDIDKLRKQKELTLKYKNEKDFDYLVEDICELYKEEFDDFINNYIQQKAFKTSYILKENKRSHLWFQRLLCGYNKAIYPNSYTELNEDIDWSKRITYYQRIAGFYNPLTKEHDLNPLYSISHEQPNSSVEDRLITGWVRYFLQDYKNQRRLYISALNKELAIKGYNFLKKYYEDAMIELYLIDYDENGELVTICLDSNGHKTIQENRKEI